MKQSVFNNKDDNLWDTVLAYKIDKKAGLIDLYEILQRINKTNIRPSNPAAG